MKHVEVSGEVRHIYIYIYIYIYVIRRLKVKKEKGRMKCQNQAKPCGIVRNAEDVLKEIYKPLHIF